MRVKSARSHIHVVMVCLLVAVLLGSCSSTPSTESSTPSTQVGTLTGAKISMGLEDLADGVVDQADFGGIVIVQLEDGSTVDAIWDNSLGGQLTGGMQLEVAPTDDPEVWKVISVVETPGD